MAGSVAVRPYGTDSAFLNVFVVFQEFGMARCRIVANADGVDGSNTDYPKHMSVYMSNTHIHTQIHGMAITHGCR